MKLFLCLTGFVLNIYSVFAQSVIINKAKQEGRDIVVTYDLPSGGKKYFVELLCSLDGGKSWSSPLQSLNGAAGDNIPGGPGKEIRWAVLEERSRLVSNSVKFKVRASLAGNSKQRVIKKDPILDKPVFIIGNEEVPFREFKYVYEKNNSTAPDAFSEKSVKGYVDLFINFKLKVLDAENAGIHNSSEFLKELEGYQKQLAKPYLTEKSVNQRLVTEAYERMKEEVNASHILIKCDPKADPGDTLVAYNRIMDLRKRILAGEGFSKIARESSEDPSAKFNDGNLGYFTAMQMVYPFEEAAYKNLKGAISNPVRTQFGYHILKVNDRRPSQGQITVAHIMVRAAPGLPAEDSIAARKKIFDIYEQLKKGGNFSMLASEFSDHSDSKTKGGILPAFGTGTMVPSFENAAFAIKDTGNYSEPFQTPFGWHIVKLVNRKVLGTFEELKASLETKVFKDSRSELSRSILIGKLRKENGFSENKDLLKYAQSKGDAPLTNGKWTFDVADKQLDEVLITIKEKKHSLRDFWKFVEKNQESTESNELGYQIKMLYNQFADECVIEYEESHLSEKYEDYRMKVKEYRDGILLYTLMNQKVWNKAKEDEAGRKAFLDKQWKKFQSKEEEISAYENFLEISWIDEMKSKNRIVIDEQLVQNLIR